MRMIKGLIACSIIFTMVACSGTKEKENVCTREGYASESTTIQSANGEIATIIIENKMEIKKDEKDSIQIFKDVFEKQFDYKGVKVSDAYNEKEEMYTITIVADFSKMKEKDIQHILGNDDTLKEKDPKALIKVLEANGFKCK